jgi:hypothetical protein
MDQFARLDQEITRLKFKDVDSSKLVAHLVHHISQLISQTHIIVENDENKDLVGLYIGNKESHRAITEMFKKIHYGGAYIDKENDRGG